VPWSGRAERAHGFVSWCVCFPIDILKKAGFRFTVIIVHNGGEVHDSFETVFLPATGPIGAGDGQRNCFQVGRVAAQPCHLKPVPIIVGNGKNPAANTKFYFIAA
jgi:hypothetical protein